MVKPERSVQAEQEGLLHPLRKLRETKGGEPVPLKARRGVEVAEAVRVLGLGPQRRRQVPPLDGTSALR